MSNESKAIESLSDSYHSAWLSETHSLSPGTKIPLNQTDWEEGESKKGS